MPDLQQEMSSHFFLSAFLFTEISSSTDMKGQGLSFL